MKGLLLFPNLVNNLFRGKSLIHETGLFLTHCLWVELGILTNMVRELFFACLWAFLVISLISIVFWTWRNGISPMPSSSKAKKTLLALLPQEIKGNIFELGSGWGTLAFPLARRFPKAQVIAYENSPLPFLFSKCCQFFYPLRNLTIERKDFYKISLAEADLVVCYLYPGAMQRLRDKLEKELKPNTWIVSNTFAVLGWQPLCVSEMDDLYKTKIYLYQSPNSLRVPKISCKEEPIRQLEQ